MSETDRFASDSWEARLAREIADSPDAEPRLIEVRCDAALAERLRCAAELGGLLRRLARLLERRAELDAEIAAQAKQKHAGAVPARDLVAIAAQEEKPAAAVPARDPRSPPEGTRCAMFGRSGQACRSVAVAGQSGWRLRDATGEWFCDRPDPSEWSHARKRAHWHVSFSQDSRSDNEAPPGTRCAMRGRRGEACPSVAGDGGPRWRPRDGRWYCGRADPPQFASPRRCDHATLALYAAKRRRDEGDDSTPPAKRLKPAPPPTHS